MADKNVVPVGFVLAPGAGKCWKGGQVGAKMQPYMLRIACHSVHISMAKRHRHRPRATGSAPGTDACHTLLNKLSPTERSRR